MAIVANLIKMHCWYFSPMIPIKYFLITKKKKKNLFSQSPT